jgi:hypothetical protein
MPLRKNFEMLLSKGRSFVQRAAREDYPFGVCIEVLDPSRKRGVPLPAPEVTVVMTSGPGAEL